MLCEAGDTFQHKRSLCGYLGLHDKKNSEWTLNLPKWNILTHLCATYRIDNSIKTFGIVPKGSSSLEKQEKSEIQIVHTNHYCVYIYYCAACVQIYIYIWHMYIKNQLYIHSRKHARKYYPKAAGHLILTFHCSKSDHSSSNSVSVSPVCRCLCQHHNGQENNGADAEERNISQSCNISSKAATLMKNEEWTFKVSQKCPKKFKLNSQYSNGKPQVI